MAGAAQPDPSSGADSGVNSGVRPMAPHLQIWRWHVTMAVSILHRASGVGLYIGAILFAGWLMAVAAGPEAYAPVANFLLTPIGQIGLYALVGALSLHLANGVRHLVLDTGRGMAPSDADASAWFVILFGVAAPVGLWALVSFGF